MAEFVDCDINAIPLEVLVRGLLTLDTNDNVALRTVNSIDSGDDVLDCDLKNLSMEQVLRRAIIIDGNGKPAINLAVFP